MSQLDMHTMSLIQYATFWHSFLCILYRPLILTTKLPGRASSKTGLKTEAKMGRAWKFPEKMGPGRAWKATGQARPKNFGPCRALVSTINCDRCRHFDLAASRVSAAPAWAEVNKLGWPLAGSIHSANQG